jgi:glycosyl-4,4'-diaponeurosporenoate acyltransferase
VAGIFPFSDGFLGDAYMRIIFLPTFWTVLADFAAWFFFHLGASVLAQVMPDRLFAADRGLYRTRAWEREGHVWQTLFRVRSWKQKLPDGALIMGRGYVKRTLQSSDSCEMDRFILESRRAELAHLCGLMPAVLFFLWNPPAAGWLMILYAIVANFPCLIAQRYNRPRFQKILALQRKRSTESESIQEQGE